jgi:transcriptional regulator with XRE-family HTH domain
MNTIYKQLKLIRGAKGLSQEEMAEILGVSRPTYAEIEKGQGEVTVSSLEKFAKYLGVSAGLLLSADDFRAELDTNKAVDKYKSMLLYAIECGGDDKDGRITKTKLAKLLYLADFAWFYKHLKPMSGLQYRRLNYGPVPDQYFRAVDELAEENKIGISTSTKGDAYMIELTESSAPKTGLTKEEMSFISDICKKWKNRNTKDIVAFTHNQLPWKLCRKDEFIPYELIIQEDPEHVF